MNDEKYVPFDENGNIIPQLENELLEAGIRFNVVTRCLIDDICKLRAYTNSFPDILTGVVRHSIYKPGYTNEFKKDCLEYSDITDLIERYPGITMSRNGEPVDSKSKTIFELGCYMLARYYSMISIVACVATLYTFFNQTGGDNICEE